MIKFTKIYKLSKYIDDIKKKHSDRKHIPNLKSLSSRPCSFTIREQAEYIGENKEGSIYFISEIAYKNLKKIQLP